MCSIIGIVKSSYFKKELLDMVDSISYRGLDGEGFYSNKVIDDRNKLPKVLSGLSLAHSLHSIVGMQPQPLKGEKGILIANCEIYNYKEINKKYNFKTESDSMTLLLLIEKLGIENLDNIYNELDGVWAFAYYEEKSNRLYLSRDILGIKPLYYFKGKDNFRFASEKKAIKDNAIELDPRDTLILNMNINKIDFTSRDLEKPKEIEKSYEIFKKETQKFLEDAIIKRIPNKKNKIGLLFSGGIDSTYIALTLKKLKIPFTCYTAKANGGNMEEAQDYIYANEISKKYNLDLKVAQIDTKDLEPDIIEVIKLIEDTNYIKISVALPFYLSCKKAKEDGIKVMFSGLGSEEIFAGYKRHKKVEDPNDECHKGLLTLNKRDLYRDDVICMKFNQELRLPYLDKNLINYALKIPHKHKLNVEENRSKIILREIASDSLKLEERYAERQKSAAQYGSKFDKALLRLAKDKGQNKQDYLNTLARKIPNYNGNIMQWD